MTRLFARVLLLSLAACLLSAASAAFAQDSAALKAEFLSGNPNSDGWEVGFLDDDGNFVAYNSTFDDGRGIAGWAYNSAPGPEGAITINYTDNPIDAYGVHWEPGQVCALSPLHGQGVVMRWTALESTDVQVDTDLTCQMLAASPKIEIKVDGKQLIAESIQSADNSVSTAGLSGKKPNGPHKFIRSAKTAIKKGNKVDLIISPAGDGPTYHMSIFISINPVGSNGVASARTSFGSCGSNAVAKKPVLMGKAE